MVINHLLTGVILQAWNKWLAGFLFSTVWLDWSPPWSGKSPRRLGRVGVQCRGCIGGFLCLVSDFKIQGYLYLLSIVGSLQLGFTTRFLPPKSSGLFFHPISGIQEIGPQLKIYSSDPTVSTLFKTDWLVDMQWFYYAFNERISDQKLFFTESSESNPNRVEVWDLWSFPSFRSSPWHVRLLYKTFSKFPKFSRSLEPRVKNNIPRNFSTSEHLIRLGTL